MQIYVEITTINYQIENDLCLVFAPWLLQYLHFLLIVVLPQTQ